MLEISGVQKSFALDRASVAALRGVNLALAAGEFFVLLGPSGCGKTTMLRSVAGLEHPEAGDITIDGIQVFSANERVFVPPERRPIGMVFQSYAVWPHMDVYGNIAFPLQKGVRQLARTDVDARVQGVAKLLGIEEMLDRPVTTLSGGQQQRVALARALALQPKVMLMDEPLSNLDLKLQMRLRGDIKALMKSLGLTTLYVTHNQNEALEMGDRIAVMDSGRIAQIGAPADLYRTPRTEFVARFIGETNLIAGRIAALDPGFAKVETGLGAFQVSVSAANGHKVGDRCFLGIRPEDVTLTADDGASAQNQVSGTVRDVHFFGEGLAYGCDVGGQDIRVKAHRSHAFAAGGRVRVSFPPDYAFLVEP